MSYTKREEYRLETESGGHILLTKTMTGWELTVNEGHSEYEGIATTKLLSKTLLDLSSLVQDAWLDSIGG